MRGKIRLSTAIKRDFCRFRGLSDRKNYPTARAMDDLFDTGGSFLPDCFVVRRLTQKELAKYLSVTPSALSQATKEGRPCQGWPVSEWATYRGGEVLWYEVPDEAAGEIRPPSLKDLFS